MSLTEALLELQDARPPPDWWATVADDLRAPFPWFGGKSRGADRVWARLGNPVNLVIPFFGSGAELWARPDEPTVETINDVNGHVVNVWRSIRWHPEQVAEACDWPVSETDLHAKHRHLTRLNGRLAARCEADPFYCNPTLAGWWIWGLSCWIGSGWCEGKLYRKTPDASNSMRGVTSKAMRSTLPDLGGSSARGDTFANHGKGVNGRGMRRQIPALTKEGSAGGIHGKETRSALYHVMAELSNRLRYVRSTCGDFERVLTPAVTWKHGLTGVILDPPYAGFDHIYGTKPVSERVRAYCIANGDRPDLRIVLCGYAGEHDELKAHGWRVDEWKAGGGYANQAEEDNGNAARERIWSSPACLDGASDIKPITMGW